MVMAQPKAPSLKENGATRSVNRGVRFKVFYGKGAATATRTFRLRIIDDCEGASYELLLKLNGGSLDELEAALVHHDFGPISVEHGVIFCNLCRVFHLENVLEARAAAAFHRYPQLQCVVLGIVL